jgi:Ca2+-binding EF-hand superfamily protein
MGMPRTAWDPSDEALLSLFASVDTDHSDAISPSELEVALMQAGIVMSAEELKEVIIEAGLRRQR